MIKKLRLKFIALSMGAFFAVLAVIITGINLVNYSGVVHEADMLLEILSKNKDGFPGMPGNLEDRLPPGMSPEIPHESRYFSVALKSQDQTVIYVETSRIVSVDREQAVQYARQALDKNKGKGFVGSFRYGVRENDGRITVTFLDWGRRLDAFRSFLSASVGISLIGYLVVLGLIAFFSGRIIRPVAESYEKQKRFITDAGHEIKTPLTIIHADADVLAMELGDNEWLEDIQRQAKRLSLLTNDLVQLSRMEEEDTKLSMIEFPLSDAVSEVAASFHALAQTQQKQFESNIQPMLTWKGNEKTVSQLIHILLDNALKYAPPGGSISLTLEKQNRTVRLKVLNTTQTPIEKESLPLLFDRFYRGDPSRNSQTGGHGIGLSIAKSIVSAHGGKIQASSEDGESLLITVTLPA